MSITLLSGALLDFFFFFFFSSFFSCLDPDMVFVFSAQKYSFLLLFFFLISPQKFFGYQYLIKKCLTFSFFFSIHMGVVGWCEGVMYLMSPGRPTDIGLQLGKACYPCSR